MKPTKKQKMTNLIARMQLNNKKIKVEEIFDIIDDKEDLYFLSSCSMDANNMIKSITRQKRKRTEKEKKILSSKIKRVRKGVKYLLDIAGE